MIIPVTECMCLLVTVLFINTIVLQCYAIVKHMAMCAFDLCIANICMCSGSC